MGASSSGTASPTRGSRSCRTCCGPAATRWVFRKKLACWSRLGSCRPAIPTKPARCWMNWPRIPPLRVYPAPSDRSHQAGTHVFVEPAGAVPGTTHGSWPRKKPSRSGRPCTTRWWRCCWRPLKARCPALNATPPARSSSTEAGLAAAFRTAGQPAPTLCLSSTNAYVLSTGVAASRSARRTALHRFATTCGAVWPNPGPSMGEMWAGSACCWADTWPSAVLGIRPNAASPARGRCGKPRDRPSTRWHGYWFPGCSSTPRTRTWTISTR